MASTTTSSSMWCFEHCPKSTIVTSSPVTSTTTCPSCGSSQLTQWHLPPFTLPCPLRSVFEGQHGCSLIIAIPGDQSSPKVSRMHVGLTDASGHRVVHFDHAGLEVHHHNDHCHPSGNDWSNCLISKAHLGLRLTSTASPSSQLSPSEMSLLWNSCLKQSILKWQHLVYNECNRDCLDFVVDFARTFVLRSNHETLDRLSFVRKFVLPLTQRLAWYLALRERVLREGQVTINRGIQ